MGWGSLNEIASGIEGYYMILFGTKGVTLRTRTLLVNITLVETERVNIFNLNYF